MHTERSEPTEEQRREASADVALRGWERADAKSHAFRPIPIRDGGIYHVCEHCHARTNPARWPLFFRSGEHAGRLLWTCSTCKRKQADRDQAAVVLVSPPSESESTVRSGCPDFLIRQRDAAGAGEAMNGHLQLAYEAQLSEERGRVAEPAGVGGALP